MKSGINFTKFKKALISELMNFFGFAFFRQSTIVQKRTSHPDHNFAMLFFYNKVWKYFRENFIQSLSCKLNVMDLSIIFPSFISRFPLLKVSSRKFICDPFHNLPVCITNFDISVIVASNISSGRLGIKNSYEEATFSINKTSQISEINFIIHVYPCLKRMYHKLYRELLSTVNDLASGILNGICESLTCMETCRGNVEELPRLEIGHKSNSLPVLNSAAARLGQSLRETQDALQRDNLESSASIINCVGGTNGDIPTEMSISDVDDVFTVLQNNSGEYITNIVEADLKFGRLAA